MIRPYIVRLLSFAVCVAALAGSVTKSIAQFDLQLTLTNPDFFAPNQLVIMQDAMAAAERLWEREILGYQSGITQTVLPVTITGTNTGFGDANPTGTIRQGGFTISTAGAMRINREVIEQLDNWPGSGTSTVDDLIAHEVGHVLGIGTHWISNGVYQFGTGEYTGEFGLAAYREDFDPDAEFIPVELAGGSGTMNAHWDQLMRSSTQEGNPSDPFSLSPEIGITDQFGRDLAFELMTGAIDPDFSEPFLSRMTVQSLRDIGFAVRTVPEPSSLGLLLVSGLLLVARRSRI